MILNVSNALIIVSIVQMINAPSVIPNGSSTLMAHVPRPALVQASLILKLELVLNVMKPVPFVMEQISPNALHVLMAIIQITQKLMAVTLVTTSVLHA
jgi:hypothetical protein